LGKLEIFGRKFENETKKYTSKIQWRISTYFEWQLEIHWIFRWNSFQQRLLENRKVFLKYQSRILTIKIPILE
jgi:hypothetical protein